MENSEQTSYWGKGADGLTAEERELIQAVIDQMIGKVRREIPDKLLQNPEEK